MKNRKPIDPPTTSVPPEDEPATGQTTDTAETAVLRTLTVHEVEQHLLSVDSVDDDTRTDLQPVLEGPGK
jgi:hypothetical protein